jgi:hypothetical protein
MNEETERIIDHPSEIENEPNYFHPWTAGM